MTLDEFLALPETEPASEDAEGVVTQKPWPDGWHSVLQSEMTRRVNAFAKPGKLSLALLELRTTYGGASLVPDIAVYWWDRIPRSPDRRLADIIPGPPDIAAEIASPEQSITDLFSKCVWYVKHGVRIALIVDPDQDTVLRFRPDALPDVLTGDDRIDLDEVLPGFELTVIELFSSLVLD